MYAHGVEVLEQRAVGLGAVEAGKVFRGQAEYLAQLEQAEVGVGVVPVDVVLQAAGEAGAVVPGGGLDFAAQHPDERQEVLAGLVQRARAADGEQQLLDGGVVGVIHDFLGVQQQADPAAHAHALQPGAAFSLRPQPLQHAGDDRAGVARAPGADRVAQQLELLILAAAHVLTLDAALVGGYAHHALSAHGALILAEVLDVLIGVGQRVEAGDHLAEQRGNRHAERILQAVEHALQLFGGDFEEVLLLAGGEHHQPGVQLVAGDAVADVAVDEHPREQAVDQEGGRVLVARSLGQAGVDRGLLSLGEHEADDDEGLAGQVELQKGHEVRAGQRLAGAVQVREQVIAHQRLLLDGQLAADVGVAAEQVGIGLLNDLELVLAAGHALGRHAVERFPHRAVVHAQQEEGQQQAGQQRRAQHAQADGGDIVGALPEAGLLREQHERPAAERGTGAVAQVELLAGLIADHAVRIALVQRGIEQAARVLAGGEERPVVRVEHQQHAPLHLAELAQQAIRGHVDHDGGVARAGLAEAGADGAQVDHVPAAVHIIGIAAGVQEGSAVVRLLNAGEKALRQILISHDAHGLGQQGAGVGGALGDQVVGLGQVGQDFRAVERALIACDLPGQPAQGVGGDQLLRVGLRVHGVFEIGIGGQGLGGVHHLPERVVHAGHHAGERLPVGGGDLAGERLMRIGIGQHRAHQRGQQHEQIGKQPLAQHVAADVPLFHRDRDSFKNALTAEKCRVKNALIPSLYRAAM